MLLILMPLAEAFATMVVVMHPDSADQKVLNRIGPLVVPQEYRWSIHMKNHCLPGGVLLECSKKILHRRLAMGAVDPLVGRAKLELGDFWILFDKIYGAKKLIDIHSVYLFRSCFASIFSTIQLFFLSMIFSFDKHDFK